ncbi:MAG: signal peptidase I [Bacteroidetes bacterium]|nr:signal peptidase I [Bacteroidota bacterium]
MKWFKKKEKKKYDSKLAEWLDAIIFALVVAGFIRIFFIQAYRIPTESMESTQLAGDFLFVNNFIYGAKIPFTDWRVPGLRMPEQGDIVVFIYPKDHSLDYIKRCIAVGGDTIQVKDKQVFVNGIPFENPPKSQFLPDTNKAGVRYINDQVFPFEKPWNRDNYGPLYVPKKGDVLPMNSETFSLYQDCIIYETGVKPRLLDDMVYLNGKPLTSYTVQQNYYFMMGDNRDNSADSRYWGFVPESNVRGKALITYWSWDQAISFAHPIDLLASIRWSRIARLIY